MRISLIPLVTAFAAILSGCMPSIHPPESKQIEPKIAITYFQTSDGATLPLRQWLPNEKPKAVLIALHGFNDYSHFFSEPGVYLSNQGIACFAYDQRGFGMAPKRGLWAGIPTYIDDLNVFIRLTKVRYPNVPIYLLGESMGGAVLIATMSQSNSPSVAGIILVAPALWARQTMPWYQTTALWALAHTVPWVTLTGRGIKVRPSDNIEMLRALGRDPLTIKKTRVEAIYGLTNLMDLAFNSADKLTINTLMLYGENDELIPKQPTYDFLRRFLSTEADKKKVAFYEHGYHMLLRDLQAIKPWEDIATWITQNEGVDLPSGADKRAKELLKPKLR